nr:zinc finger, CCHC-type [Tanacetum cinerariifolium]
MNFLEYLEDFNHTLQHLKEELTLIELGSHMCIEESFRVQESDKPNGNNVVGPSVVNMCGKPRHLKKDCKAGNVGNRVNGSNTKGSEDGSSNPLKGQNMFNKSLQIYYVTYVSEAYFVEDDDIAWWVDSEATMHVCKDRCWFKNYESLNDGSILYMGNESTALVRGRGCIDLREAVRLPDPKLRTLGESGIECIFVGYAEHSKAFRFYVIELNNSVAINSIIESKDSIFDEHRFSSVPRPSQRSLKDETEDSGGSVVTERVIEEVTNLWVANRSLKEKLKVDGTIEKFKARLVIQGFKQKSRIDYFDTYALVERISTIRLLIAMASIHNLIIHQMDVKTAFLNGKLEEEASMKQTCITGSTMEYEFVALAAAGKEAEWLKNLLLEIPLWVKSIAPIYIRCDSDATLAKAYSQMYNGKSRHLGVRHSMIRELITNVVVSIEFVRSQQNLADHLTKGLARDLVIKSVEGMGLKSN